MLIITADVALFMARSFRSISRQIRSSRVAAPVAAASYNSARALGRNTFSGGHFAVALRMNAAIVPRRLRKIDVIVFRSLLDVGEGQGTIGTGNAMT
jgi:hypothetical protein